MAKALAALNNPVVVVLDDIDRLTTFEIRDVFRLVRLTASFPNVVYVVAFDRVRVEAALNEQGIPGRDYLEKILQVGVDLPAIPQSVLNTQVFAAIDTALADIENPGQFDEGLWPDVFMEVIRPLVRNLRDVRRYSLAIYATIRDLAGQVALVDVLALEAIRVFLPDVFHRLGTSVEALTTTSDRSSGARERDAFLKQEVDRMIEAAGDRAEIVRDLIRRLFPAAGRHVAGMGYDASWKPTWIRDRRVAHEDVLRFYLERVAGEGFQAHTEAEQAWSRMADKESLESFLHSVDARRREDVIAALETFEDQFRPEHVVPACTVLLNMLAELPERPRSLFDLGKKVVVTRVVLRLLKSLKDPGEIERAVRKVLLGLNSLSSKLEIAAMVGYRAHSGQKLVSEEAAAEMEKKWRAEVREAASESLCAEEELIWVLLLARREADPKEEIAPVPNRPDVTLALLRSSRSDELSQSDGSRAVRRSPRLAWKALLELIGSEDELRRRIEDLKVSRMAGADELIALADRYLDGWEPDRFTGD